MVRLICEKFFCTEAEKTKLHKKEIFEKPLKVLKKINLDKFKKITSFSLNRTFDNFKKKIKQAEIDRIESLKKEKINEAKKEKLEQKKKKIEEEKQIKKEQLLKIKKEEQRLKTQEKQKLKIEKQQQQIAKQKLR